MKTRSGMLLLLSLFSLLFSLQQEIRPPESQLFEVTQHDKSNLSLRFEQPQCEINEISVRGESAQLLTGENVSLIEKEGMPALPYYSTVVSVPARGSVTLRVNGYDARTTTDIRIPAATGVDISGNETRNPGFAYKIDDLYPLVVAEISEPKVLRDERFVILTVYPYAYNPETRELVTRSNIDLDVVTDSSPGINEIISNRKRSRSFETLYSSLFLNYHRDDEAEYQARSILIIYPDLVTAEDFVRDLGRWKRMKGFEVNYLNTGDLSYDSSTNIKNYIQDAYDSWDNPPEYLILVGDTSGSLDIPTWTENYSGYQGCGDNPYTTLDGSDLIPDAFVGRISVGSAGDLLTVWSKIVNYEIDPYRDNLNWYNHSAMISDTGQSGISTYFTNEFVRESILWYDPDHTFTVVKQNSPPPSSLSNAIDAGSLVFSYRGIGQLNGWDTTDIANLDNGLMLCNLSIITCNTGTFDDYEVSRTEALLRAGTSSAPKGAIGAIGMATNGTHTPFNNALHGGMWYGLYMQGMNTMGEALVRGKLHLHKSYSGSFVTFVKSFSHWCNLMGDPSLDVWKATPKEFVVEYEETLPVGSSSMQVRVVDSSGNGVEDAWATIYQTDEFGNELLFATGYTDQSGYIRLYFPSDTEGYVDLTVTKPQHVPELKTVSISDGGIVGVLDVFIDDDNDGESSGNDNGDPNSGETIELLPVLMNYRGETVGNISAILRSSDPYITVIDNSEDFDDIESGASGTCRDDFEISISLDCPDRHEADLVLEVTTSSGTWECHVPLTIKGSDLDITGYSIAGDGVLDPAESAVLTIDLTNNGFADLSSVQGRLTPLASYVGVPDSVAIFGDIPIGQEVTCQADNFRVSASSVCIPGMTAKFRLDLWNDDGYSENEVLTIPIGFKQVTDPAGPDQYGYFCFDQYDTGYDEVPEYDWIEIDPSEGGSGTNTGMSDAGENQDKIDDVLLPFTFRFYGQDYNRIWISTNGYITFTESNISSFRNWHLPGPMGPRAMIAAFWDDLTTQYGSGVYTWHNAQEHYFVIEWSDMRNYYDSSQETFEIILYDPVFYPTSTGDGMIKIQYDDFNNTDQGTSSSYWPEHGNYCTIGLENHDSDDGIEYSFNNNYTSGAHTLSDNNAILFTTLFAGAQETYLRIIGVDIIDSNYDDTFDYGSQIEFNVSVENTGTGTANNVTTVLSTDNPHVTIIQATSDYPSIASGTSEECQQPFVIKVDPFCPDGEYVRFDFEITSGENVFERELGFTCRAPALSIEAFTMQDESDDGMLVPGESATYSITIMNDGSFPANNVFGLISCDDPYIEFSDDEFEIETIIPYHSNSLESCFSFTVSETSPGINHFRVNVMLSDQGKMYWLRQFDFSVGFLDTVELGEGDWNHYVLNENYDMWDLDTYRSFSPETSWKCGGAGPNNYYDDSMCALESPMIDITSTSCLTFHHWMEAEDSSSYPGYGYDGGLVEIWSGDQWQQIEPVGGYPFLARGPSCQFDLDTPIYSGDIDWEIAYFDLSGFDETVRFRFVFGSDVGTTGEGWYIDDIAITEMDAVMLPPEDLVAEYLGNQQIEISWQPSQTEGTHYNIYRRVQLDQPYQLITSVTDTTFTDDSAVQSVYNYYVVTRASATGESPYSNATQAYCGSLDQQQNDVPVYVTALGQNYPNPFNPETIIPFSLKNDARVTIDIYNIRGQCVKSLTNERYAAGEHQIVWDARNDAGQPIASGIYFSRMRADGRESVRKMLLLK